jgi:hypothetical protein
LDAASEATKGDYLAHTLGIMVADPLPRWASLLSHAEREARFLCGPVPEVRQRGFWHFWHPVG